MFSVEQCREGLTLSWNGQPVLGYQFPETGHRPFCHPLNLPGAPLLTMNEPGDHVHHQGLWLAWKKVNGVNFWEQPAPGGDPTGFGRIVQQRVVSVEADVEHAQLVTENAWIDWQGTQHLTERRELTLSAPTDTAMAVSLSFTLSPIGRPVVLDLRRGTPGADGRYYSGLAVRFHNSVTPGALLDADGRTEAEDIFGQRSRWCSFTTEHPADGETYGIAIVDDPRNPRYPTPWWVRNRENYCLIHPSPVYAEPFRLALGETLGLQYRVVLYRGEPDIALFEV